MAEELNNGTPPPGDQGGGTPPPADNGAGTPNPPMENAPTPWYGTVNERYGTKFESEEQADTYWKQLHQPKQPEYPEEWVSEFVQGVASRQTPQERREYMRQYAFVNGTDWNELATTNPDEVIKAAMRIDNPQLEDRVVNYRFNNRYKTKPEDYPNLSEEEAELAAADAMASKRADAMAALNTLKGKSASLSPKNGQQGAQKSPEEAYSDLLAKYTASAKAVASSFKVDAGGESYSLGEADIAKVASPEALQEIAGYVFKDGQINPEGMAQLASELHAYRSGTKSLLERAVKKATDDLISKRLNGIPPDGEVRNPPADKEKEAAERAYYMEKFGSRR